MTTNSKTESDNEQVNRAEGEFSGVCKEKGSGEEEVTKAKVILNECEVAENDEVGFA